VDAPTRPRDRVCSLSASKTKKDPSPRNEALLLVSSACCSTAKSLLTSAVTPSQASTVAGINGSLLNSSRHTGGSCSMASTSFTSSMPGSRVPRDWITGRGQVPRQQPYPECVGYRYQLQIRSSLLRPTHHAIQGAF